MQQPRKVQFCKHSVFCPDDCSGSIMQPPGLLELELDRSIGLISLHYTPKRGGEPPRVLVLIQTMHTPGNSSISRIRCPSQAVQLPILSRVSRILVPEWSHPLSSNAVFLLVQASSPAMSSLLVAWVQVAQNTPGPS